MGKNAVKAFDRMEVLEFTARSLFLANSVSGIAPIGEAEIAQIESAFNGW